MPCSREVELCAASDQSSHHTRRSCGGVEKPRAPVRSTRYLAGNVVKSNNLGNIQGQLFCLKGRVRGLPCRILIDCGSSENCMSQGLAKRAKIATVELKNQYLVMADGKQGLETIHETQEPIVLEIGAHRESLKFVVAPLRYDIILGLPWFERHQPQVDWIKRKIQVGDVELSESGFKGAARVATPKEAVPVYAVLVKEEIDTKGDHADQGELKKLMSEFQDVFSKELPHGVSMIEECHFGST